MTRTERQQESVKRWLSHKGKGTIVGATGYGKTRCALMAIKALLKNILSLGFLLSFLPKLFKNNG